MELNELHYNKSFVNERDDLSIAYDFPIASYPNDEEHPKIVVSKTENQVMNFGLPHHCELGKLSPETPYRSSSRASSAKWRVATDVIVATNTMRKLTKHKMDVTKNPNRKMKGLNAYIPVVSLPLSIVFCVMNCIIPGFGTILSSFTFCCSATTFDEQDRNNLDKRIAEMVMVNLIIGLAQLLTTTFLLVGWFWSLSRGITMIYLAIEAKEAQNQKHHQILQTQKPP